jgi:hypothetical protein
MAPSPANAAISSPLSKSLTPQRSVIGHRRGAAPIGSLRIRIREAHSRWSHWPKGDNDARFLTLRDVCGKIPAQKNRSQRYVDRIRLTVSCRCLHREEFARESLAEKKTQKRFAPPGTTIGVKESLLNVEPAKKKQPLSKRKSRIKITDWSR